MSYPKNLNHLTSSIVLLSNIIFDLLGHLPQKTITLDFPTEFIKQLVFTFLLIAYMNHIVVYLHSQIWLPDNQQKNNLQTLSLLPKSHLQYDCNLVYSFRILSICKLNSIGEGLHPCLKHLFSTLRLPQLPAMHIVDLSYIRFKIITIYFGISLISKISKSISLLTMSNALKQSIKKLACMNINKILFLLNYLFKN